MLLEPAEIKRWTKAINAGAVLVLINTPCVLAQSAQDRLGTLFYSPAERAVIAATRKGDDLAREANAARVSVSGVVRRAGGKGTAWINGRPIAEGETLTATGIPTIQPGRVLINGEPVRVRETLELETGIRGDALPPGAVTVRRTK